MFHNALLVAVEGVDGAGKNTLTRKVSALLESSGKHVSHIAFPRYGTLHADLAAAALHGEMGDLVESAYAMATLFALDRRESLQPGGGLAALVDTPAPDTQVVQTAEPSQEISRIIMMDRWVASNAAYSAARLRESIQQPGGVVEWVAALEYGQFQLPAPDITILLDVPVALARKRAAQREASDTARRRDLYEHDSSLQERTASAYRDLAHAHWYGPWLSVSADVNPEDVARAILAAKIGVPPHRGQEACMSTGGATMAHILIVDDDEALAEMLGIVLENEGFTTTIVGDGNEALRLYQEINPVLILLDLMLPGMNGVDVCKEIRRSSAVPIIMLTAKTDTIDVVLGLESGADDYVTKPFKPKELVARVRARLRHNQEQSSDVLTIGNVSINVDAHTVTRDGKYVSLTPLEFNLLKELASKPGRVLSRETLLEHVWGYDHAADSRLINVHVQRLRSKIEEDPENPKIVVTVRGIGYKAGTGN